MDRDTELCYLGEKSIASANWSIDYKGMVLLSIMYLKGLSVWREQMNQREANVYTKIC